MVSGRSAATFERRLPVEILVGPDRIAEVYRLEGNEAARGDESATSRGNSGVAWEESRAARKAQQPAIASPPGESWSVAVIVALLAALAAWLIVR